MSAISAPPSRQTACDHCVRAKRRCDLLTPQCSRCLSRSLSCFYKNEPLTAPLAPIEAMQFGDFMLGVDFDPSSGLNLANPRISVNDTPAPSLPSFSERLLRWSSIQSRDTVAWMVEHLKSYPRMLILHTNTPFIHARLYQVNLPKVMQDTFSICATYQAMTRSNKSMVLRIIEVKVEELIQDDMFSFSWSLADNLGHCQALILVLIIFLFDGDIRLRALGEEYQNLLSKWTEQLQWQFNNGFNNLQQLSTQSWVIAESTRRTILMTYLIRGLYSFCKLGRCDADAYTHATAMCRLQFTAEALLWDSPSVDDPSQCSQGLISYGELDRGVRRSLYMPAFEKLLLVACKGQECSELIVSG